MRIGFIGLGNMGTPMATKLVSAGYEVIGYDPKKNKIDGIIHVDSVSKLASNSNIIFTMLPSGTELKMVYEEIIPLAKSKTILIDCSTVDVTTTQKLSAQAQSRNLSTLDAPVSGGVVGAETGSLTFMVGGDVKCFNRVLPLFEVMGTKVVLCGASGAGQSAKICNNMILGISMIGVCEAFSLADKLGLNRQKMFDVASTSSASCWSLNTYCPATGVGPESPADNHYQPGFAAELMLKDLTLAQEAATEVGAPTPLGQQAQRLYQELISKVGKNKDFSAMLSFFETSSR